MSTGNPYGLSEISHYGSMRNVGGKAGGFINKKFFHPSSLRNQEKLWKAITADAVEKRKQDDLEKAREEERKVDALRKEMYLAGQSKSAMFTAASETAQRGTLEQIKAHRELKRRKELLKVRARSPPHQLGPIHRPSLAMVIWRCPSPQLEGAKQPKEDKDEDVEIMDENYTGELPPVKMEEEDGEDGEDGEGGEGGGASSSRRILVKSKYPEDVLVRGHSQIWGSWFTLEEQRWGFACCHSTDAQVRCPQNPEEPPDEALPAHLEKSSKRQAKRRKREAEEAASGPVSRVDLPSISGPASE
ncbi:unnamed protein product [Durusdinium trenchii]|uniref:Pre-mRNA-splicing factor SLU7 n=1 Tax=Durusdinium trenchii TaxID=1381693 RepID=A0ABP0MQV2_9DINO